MRAYLALAACALFAASGVCGLLTGSYKQSIAAVILAIANALLLT